MIEIIQKLKNYMTGTSKIKILHDRNPKGKGFSIKCIRENTYHFKLCKKKNRSENDLKSVKWSVHLETEGKYVWYLTCYLWDIHTKENDVFSLRKRAKNVLKSIQKNCENGSETTQNKTAEGVSTWKQWKNLSGTLCNSYTRKMEQFHWENERNCRSPNNMIMRMGYQWLKKN